MDYSVNFKMPTMDSLKAFNDNFKNMEKINPGSGSPTTLNGYISQNQDLSNDPELSNDLNTLLGAKGAVQNADGPASEFANTLSHAVNGYMNDTNNSQRNAEAVAEDFASGGNVDVHTVMIAAEKANLSMQLTMQLRNKLLQAYQEVSKLQV